MNLRKTVLAVVAMFVMISVVEATPVFAEEVLPESVEEAQAIVHADVASLAVLSGSVMEVYVEEGYDDSVETYKYEFNYTKRQKKECRFARNGRMNEEEVRDTIRCVNRRWDAGLRSAFRICWRESRCKAYADNKTSSAYGPYQWLTSSYKGARQKLKSHRPLRKVIRRWNIGKSRKNPRSNIFVAIVTASKGGWDTHWSLTN